MARAVRIAVSSGASHACAQGVAHHEGPLSPSGGDSGVLLRDRLLRIKDVCALVGLSQSRIFELVAEGAFPRAVRIGGASRYSELEVQAWIAARKQERDHSQEAGV